MKIRRQVNKYLLHFKFNNSYVFESQKRLFEHKFLIFHKQAEIFRKFHRGNNIDAGALFDKFGDKFLDWYPLDNSGNIVDPNCVESDIFSTYTGFAYWKN